MPDFVSRDLLSITGVEQHLKISQKEPLHSTVENHQVLLIPFGPFHPPSSTATNGSSAAGPSKEVAGGRGVVRGTGGGGHQGWGD